ncbi:MAG: MGMT family protein [Deltaproteobacteria bacterium]|nr:MGMT family protein [Deltaproteobacteria bacterium]
MTNLEFIPLSKAAVTYATLELPFAQLRVSVGARGLLRVELASPQGLAGPTSELALAAATELEALVWGRREDFGLPIELAGTPFEREVWQALARIPRGRTSTYGRLASELGRTSAARAVGSACHKNPVPIVIPCHRVVGSTGALTGYALGLPIKSALLGLEGAESAPTSWPLQHVIQLPAS